MAALPLLRPRILRNSFLLRAAVHTRRQAAPCKKKTSLVRIRASENGVGEADDDNTALISQEDLKYLGGLGAVSISGAAVIKYGSIVFPEITKPDITQALLMIFLPVIVAVLLLIKQSRRLN